MNLVWIEEAPNYHVARIELEGLGVDVQAVAKVFLAAHGYVVETGIGTSIQTDGGRLDFDPAKELATRMLERQLTILQEQIQGALKGGEEQGFGEVRPDGG